MSKFYTVCTGVRKGLALLFDSQNTADIAKEPALKKLFPRGFFAILVGYDAPKNKWYRGYYNRNRSPDKRVLISNDIEYPLPDGAKLDDPPVGYYRGDALHLVNLRTRYNNCFSLIKAVGCDNCPDKGSVCFSEAVSQQYNVDLSGASSTDADVDFESALELLRAARFTIAGHTFVEPTKTRTTEFSATERPYWEHDFSRVENNAKEMSERSTKAAKTRRFAKEHCRKCPLDKGCGRASHCNTRYAPADVLVKHGVEKVKQAIQGSALKPWQIWTLNNHEGAMSKHSRWNIVLGGVQLSDNVFVPSIYRSKTDIEPYKNLKTYEEIADVFGLPKEEKSAVMPEYTDDVLGLWWQVLKLHGHSSRGYSPKFLMASSVQSAGVRIQWAKDRYISWSDSVKEFKHISSKIYYGRLPDAPFENIDRSA